MKFLPQYVYHRKSRPEVSVSPSGDMSFLICDGIPDFEIHYGLRLPSGDKDLFWRKELKKLGPANVTPGRYYGHMHFADIPDGYISTREVPELRFHEGYSLPVSLGMWAKR